MAKTTPKKGRIRSPHAPSIDLEDALGKSRLFHSKEPTRSAPAQIAIKHMGYNLSGSGLGVLASLKRFGLIETRGDEASLSKLALDIIEDKRLESEERETAIRRAALLPRIHAKVFANFNGTIPSDETLLHYLRKELDFTDTGGNAFIKQFRATLTFANLEDGGKLHGDESTTKKDEPTASQRAITGSFHPGKDEYRTPQPPAAWSDALTTRPTMIQHTFDLNEGEVVFRWPARISLEDYQDLKVWHELMGRRMKRAVATDDDQETESE